MGQEFALAQDTTANTQRLDMHQLASRQLSDGTEVFVIGSSAATSVPKVYYKTVGGVPVLIDTLTLGAGGWENFLYSSISICVDNLDNFYLVGPNTTGAGVLRVKAYTKGAGYTWTGQTSLTGTFISSLSGNPSIDGYWCNTGGGTSSKGHLFLFGLVGGGSAAAICDAGAALAGSGTLVVNQYDNPAFANNGATFVLGNRNSTGIGFDISPDGFGATSGLAVGPSNDSGDGNTKIIVGRWGVNSSGVLSTNTYLTKLTRSASTVDDNTRIRVIRVSSNKWAIIYNSTTASGRYMVTTWSATAQITAPTDSGAPTSMPLNGAGYATWEVFLHPVTGKLMVIAATASATSIYGLGVDCSSGITFDAAVTAVDAALGTGIDTILRAVKNPQSPDHTDIEAYNNNSGTYAVVGESYPSQGNTHQLVQAA